jgi:hypothetical protein
VLPYEKVALKDVVWLDTGETVRVIARYAPWDGLYMFHCESYAGNEVRNRELSAKVFQVTISSTKITR